MKETSWVEVELYYLAEHQWEQAPRHRNYLRPLHQHLFKITVRISVSHGERQVEFHDFRAELWDILKLFDAQSKLIDSCENNAKQIFKELQARYKKHKIAVVFAEEGGMKGKYGHEVS